MKKICEIDALKQYRHTGIMPWYCQRLNTQWLEHTFAPAQILFLEKHRYTARPHPKRISVVEIFIDEHTLEEPDWTVLHLLFTRPRSAELYK